MVKNQLILFIKFVTFFVLIVFNKNVIANPNADQWQDSNKSYKDLIQEGFEVKAYSMNTIETNSGLQLYYLLQFCKKILKFMNVKNIKP